MLCNQRHIRLQHKSLELPLYKALHICTLRLLWSPFQRHQQLPPPLLLPSRQWQGVDGAAAPVVRGEVQRSAAVGWAGCAGSSAAPAIASRGKVLTPV